MWYASNSRPRRFPSINPVLLAGLCAGALLAPSPAADACGGPFGSAGGPPAGGGPCDSKCCQPPNQTVGDPVDVVNGATFEQYVDFTLHGSSVEVPFRRSFTSYSEVWGDRYVANKTSVSTLENVPKPFGSSYPDAHSLNWWHNFYSLVSIDPTNSTQNWMVHDRSGANEIFDGCTGTPCWATNVSHNDFGAFSSTMGQRNRLYHAATDEYRLYDGAGWILIYGSSGKFVPQPDSVGVVTTRYFLTEMDRDDGRKMATIAYSLPVIMIGGVNVCPAGASGTASGVPYISTITTADGLTLTFHYTALPPVDRLVSEYECVISSITLADSTTVASYTYQTDQGTPPSTVSGMIASASLLDRTISYSTPSYSSLTKTGDFVASIAGTEVTHHAYCDVAGCDPGACVCSSRALSENLTFTAESSAALLSNINEVYKTATISGSYGSQETKVTVDDLNACVGDGTTTTPVTYSRDIYGVASPSEMQGRFYFDSPSATSAALVWAAPSYAEEEWTAADTDGNQNPRSDRDRRSAWTGYTYSAAGSGAADGTTTFPQLTELTTLADGASDASGTSPLVSTSVSYTYANHAQQKVSSESQASVINAGHTASTTYGYDSAVAGRVSSEVRHGWTNTMDGTGNWNLTERYVGTFYFRNYQCSSGSTNDPFNRTVEIHGPCLIASGSSTDCDSGGAIPITQIVYYGATATANKANQIQTVSRYTNNTTSSCSGASHLDTTVNSYDALGNPTSVTGPDGVAVALTYSGNKLASVTKNSAAWNFTYDGGLIGTLQYPQGNYEVLCHRSGATGACSGGTWSDKLQWKAKFDSTLSTWTERVEYAYWPDGTLQTETYKDSSSTRMVVHHGANILRQPTYSKLGDATSASSYRAIQQFNGEGDVTAIGFPFNDPPAFCGSAGSVSASCAATNLDRLGRLSSLVQTPNPASPSTSYTTNVTYDAQSNVSSITAGCSGSGTCSVPSATYQYDDFRHLVAVTAPWLDNGSGASGTTRMQYDAMGSVVRKQTPEMAHSTEYLASGFDQTARQTSLAVQVIGGSSQTLYAFAYDGGSTPPSSCDQPSYTGGRLLKRTDSFGDTWYQYDALGRVTEEIRLRTGVSSCTGAATQDIQNTKYTWSTNGNLTSIVYPFGRTITYTYGTTGAPDRATAISSTQYSGTAWSTAPGTSIISSVTWEPYGGLRSYTVVNQAAGTPAYVNYLHVAPGGSIDPHTGLLASLTVGTTSTGTDIYRRDYTWQADQVTQTDTYLLGATTARTETYSYDALLRLTGMSGTNFSTVGGAVGSRSYGYDGRGNRTSQTNEDCGYALTYGTSTHPDQLTSRASSCTGSILATAYAYDRDGRVSSMTGPNDSSGSAAWQFTMTDGPDSTSGALDSVYKSISVNGAVYSYYYDAFNRRRAKQYPLSMVDEFYYRTDNLLLVDLGNDSTVTVTAHPVDDYVWLDRRPVAIVRGKVNSSYARQADTSGADCTRNGEYQQCGTFALVTDHIDAPVLMLDDHRRVVGEGSMDPFGPVNTVSLNKESAHPYANNTNVTLADFRQPAWGTGTSTRLRVLFAVVDTETNSGTPVDSVTLKDGDTGTTLASGIGGHHAGRIVSGWVTPSAGRAQVVFTSSASNCCPATGGGLDCSGACTQAPNYPYTGVVVEAYQYQRYQSTASPSWMSLRYPGQYYDQESSLAQNWNRFYDGLTGRYKSPEPLVHNPGSVRKSTENGRTLPVYAYAENMPTSTIDGNGLWPFPWQGGKLCTSKSCKKPDLKHCQNLPEDSPKPIDNPALSAQYLGPAPDPGECTDSDGVYMNSGDVSVVKIPNDCKCTIECDENGSTGLSCVCWPGILPSPTPYPPGSGQPPGWPPNTTTP